MSATRPETGPAPDRALDGLRVLDLSRVLAGPLCTMHLADLGAEVIKIERPGSGDDTRAWGPPFVAGESAYFLTVNRNKRSVACDLRHPEGLALVHALAARADIVVENFPPGKAVALGVDLAAMRAERPSLVTCSITGFGPAGPDSGRPGYDALIQAMGGLMSITGEPDGPPCKVGVAIADVLAGKVALSGILAALFHRERTGRGQHVSVALQDALVEALVNQGQAFLTSGVVPGRLGSAHPHIVPYQAFPTADGHIVIAVGNDDQFDRLCTILGRPDLARDERFATNAGRVRHRDELVGTLAGVLSGRPTAHWLEACVTASVPAGPIRSLDAVLTDPQLVDHGMVARVEHPTVGSLDVLGNAMRLSGTPPRIASAPPLLGEHTDLVLREVLGLDGRRIGELRGMGAIA